MMVVSLLVGFNCHVNIDVGAKRRQCAGVCDPCRALNTDVGMVHSCPSNGLTAEGSKADDGAVNIGGVCIAGLIGGADGLKSGTGKDKVVRRTQAGCAIYLNHPTRDVARLVGRGRAGSICGLNANAQSRACGRVWTWLGRVC